MDIEKAMRKSVKLFENICAHHEFYKQSIFSFLFFIFFNFLGFLKTIHALDKVKNNYGSNFSQLFIMDFNKIKHFMSRFPCFYSIYTCKIIKGGGEG